MAKANEAQFFFYCGDLEKSTFEVAEFSGIERISSLYQFDVTLMSRNFIRPEEVIGLPATLFIQGSGEYVPYSGVVKDFQFIDNNVDYCTYSARLVPRLWMTSLNVQSRIFQKVTINDILTSVLDSANVTNYEINLNGTYPEQEYVVQYQESDLNFISRLMEAAGIWYFFQENPLLPNEIGPGVSNEKLIVSDDPANFTDLPSNPEVLFRRFSGMNERYDDDYKESIHQFQVEQHIIPKDVFVKNYNYRSPEVDLTGRQNVSDGLKGTVYEYGGNFKRPAEAQAAAEVLSKRIQSQHVTINGSGNCRGFRAGFRFTLQESYFDELNTAHLITQVQHAGGHLAGHEVATYQNNFRCIPGDQATSYCPEKRAFIPKVNGVLTALIEANGSEYAHVDEFGRYKVRLPFDLSDARNDCSGSKYVRLAQPYSGSQYGFHFPSHEGAEMVLACVDGDPNKPVGIGTVPNANTVSPVISDNKQTNVIRTAGGNEFIMDDTDGKQKVRLLTNNSHCIEMDDENKRLYLQTTDQNKLLLDDQNECASWNAKGHVITMSYKSGEEGVVISTADGHVVKIDDKGKRITIQSKGGHKVDMDDQGKKITLTDGQGKNTVTLDGSKGLILDTQGKLSINAQQDIEISGANIKMSSAMGKIDVKATTDLTMSGINLTQKATANCKIEGLQFEAKGTAGVKIQGAMTEVKGDATLKVSGGAMAEVSGGGMTTIKGGVVMIN